MEENIVKKPSLKDKKVYKLLATMLVCLIVLVVGNIVFPTFFRIVWNIIWFFMLSVVIVFIGLGTLVIFGLKEEAQSILDLLLEGSLTFVDFTNFVKKLIERFIKKLKEFVLFIAPLIGYLIAFWIYILLIYLYKLVGTRFEVTVLTIFLTILLVCLVGIFTKPYKVAPVLNTWSQIFVFRIKRFFTDGFELVIFLFFLTMDSTNLFFLSDSLNIPIRASLGSYDLMIRGFSFDHGRITFTVIIVAIASEIVRNIIRIINLAIKYNRESLKLMVEAEIPFERAEVFKDSVRKGFNQAKDDLIKFITFTTVLILVFLIFPRLKLLSMAVASLTSLAIDLLIPSRITSTKGADLISRLLTKAFKL